MEQHLPSSFTADPEVMYKLGSIEAQLAAINEKLDQRLGAHETRIKSLEDRVGNSEKLDAKRVGAASVVSAVFTFILMKLVPWQNLF